MLMTQEDYISSIDLKGTPRPVVAQDAGFDEYEQMFDEARAQAQVVGSGVFSFAPGVPSATRRAASNAVLLAQLVANKQCDAAVDPVVWFSHYTKVLQALGWIATDAGWVDYTSVGVAADVHHQILAALAAALGPAPDALAIITASVGALNAMTPASSWLRIFSRESQKTRIVRFHLGSIEASGDTVSASMLACVIEASKSITQLLVFKFRDAGASFNANHTRFAASGAALLRLDPIICAKVDAYQDAYLSSIVNL